MCSREDMLARGAYGYLHKALERYVPLDKVQVLTGDPACETWGTYSLTDMAALEVKYAREDDVYIAFNAASIVRQARTRGERYIRAFVEPDGKDIGPSALAELPK
jgi:hypothetical protein